MKTNLFILLMVASLDQNPCLYASEYGQNDDDSGGKQASNSQAAPASDPSNSGSSENSGSPQTADTSGADNGFGGDAGGPSGNATLSSAGGGSSLSSERAFFGGAGGGATDVCYKLCGPGTPDYNPEKLGNCVHQVESGLPADCNSWFQANNRDVNNIRRGVKAKEAAEEDRKESGAGSMAAADR